MISSKHGQARYSVRQSGGNQKPSPHWQGEVEIRKESPIEITRKNKEDSEIKSLALIGKVRRENKKRTPPPIEVTKKRRKMHDL